MSTVKCFVRCTVVLFSLCGIAAAQPHPEKPKAAVYIKGNPQGRDVLRMAVNTFLIKTGMYQMIAVDAIDNVLAQEHRRQMGGSVSDNEIATLGRDAGAQYVCVVERTEIDGVSYVTTSMVSVQSKIAEFSDMKELPRGERVINVIERQINAMLGISSGDEGGEGVSEPTGQPSPSAGSYQYANTQTEEVRTTVPKPSSDSFSGSRSAESSKPFDPSAFYVFFNMSTVDSRDYGDIVRGGSALLGGVGWDIFGKSETRNLVGGGIFFGGGTYGNGIWGIILGIEVKDLFWLVKGRLAVPMSLGFDWRPMLTKIENRVAAEFIDVMSEDDKVADTTIPMKRHNYDFTPAIGLQIFLSHTVSVYAGYAYNVSIYGDWKAYYRIPGKSYTENDDGDTFTVPDKHAPLKDPKERFLGVPGTLRLGLKIHL